MRYANGEVKIIVQDLSSNGFGVPWGHTRSYSNLLTSQTGGNNGNSWCVGQWPYIVPSDTTTMCVVIGTIYNAAWFDLVSGNYIPRFSMQCGLTHDTLNHLFQIAVVEPSLVLCETVLRNPNHVTGGERDFAGFINLEMRGMI